MKMRRIEKIKNHYGFTLLEVVSAIGLTIMIFVVIYNIFLSTHASLLKTDKRMELIQNGRIFLDRISRELRQTPKIATQLPESKNVEGFLPPNEIMFQDGHGVPDIQYLRYFIDEGKIMRQRLVYFFISEPGTYVDYNSTDEFGNPPQNLILEERTIAEYISQLMFYGTTLTNIEVWLTKGDSNEHLFTGVWGRNTRL